MAQVLVTDTNLTNIAAAIRTQLGVATTYKPGDMDDAIASIPSLKLLATASLGTISTSSTSAADTGQTVSVTGLGDYDLLIADTSVGTPANGRHVSTMNLIFLAATSTIGEKTGGTLANATLNIKLSSAGVYSERAGTTKYGVYVNSVSFANSALTLAMYQRYNSTSTGTINGTYTTRVYGVKLYDLITG